MLLRIDLHPLKSNKTKAISYEEVINNEEKMKLKWAIL